MLAGVRGELLTGLGPIDLGEGLGEAAEVGRIEVGVEIHPALALERGDRVLVAIARDPADDVSEHLSQAPVRVGREARVVGSVLEPRDGYVVEAEVENGVKHAWHRDPRAGANRDEEWILRVTEALAGGLLEAGDRLIKLSAHTLRDLPTGFHVFDAGIGRDRESRRHPFGAKDPRHLGQVRALAAQKVSHLPAALGELVDVLGGGRGTRRGLLRADHSWVE